MLADAPRYEEVVKKEEKKDTVSLFQSKLKDYGKC